MLSLRKESIWNPPDLCLLQRPDKWGDIEEGGLRNPIPSLVAKLMVKVYL